MLTRNFALPSQRVCPLVRRSFQLDDITPPCRWVFGFIIMLDGIGEHLCLTLTILLGVLLGADHDGLTAITLVDTVYHLVQALHLLNLLRIDIEQVLLERATGRYAHHNHPTPLVLNPLDENLIQHLFCCLHNGDCGACGRDQPFLVILPILQQVLSERVGTDEHTHDGGHSVLLSQLLRTTGSIVLQMKA